MANRHDYQNPTRPTRPSHESRKFGALLSHLYSNRGSVTPYAVIPIPLLVSGAGATLGLADFTELAIKIGKWFTDIFDLQGADPINLTLIWVFETLSHIIWTPAEIFNNDWFRDMVKKFSLISMSLVTALTMFEGVKRILNITHTSLRKVMIRFPIALGVCAFAPTMFVTAVEWLNKITNYIISSGVALMKESAIQNIEDIDPFAVMIDQGALILFNILYVLLLFPMLLQFGKRWFDMLALGILTPFAMLGFIFESLSKFHKKWWSTLKQLYLIQLVFALFITLLSAIMFTFPFPSTISGSFAKALVLLGGLYRLAFPPAFVNSMLDKGDDGKQAITKVVKKVGSIAIFKKATP